MIGIYGKNYYKVCTEINGVDCSFLTVDDAIKKLEKSINKAEIKLKFIDEREYSCLGAYFEIKLTNKKVLEETLNKQKNENKAEDIVTIKDLYTVNEEKIKKYLGSLSIFKKENMTKPENAYLQYDEKSKTMVIKPEKYGNEISLKKACDFMIDELKKGETIIDFTKITNSNPAILASDSKLIEEQKKLNSILTTTVEYSLDNNEKYVLDANVIKNWIKKENDGYYSIDLDNNISKFIGELKDKAEYLLTSTDFKATGKGKIKVSFGRKTYATINEEEEAKRIKEQLQNPKSYSVQPIYDPLPDYYNIGTYIELDLTRQRVWMYVNGKQILNSPCVTGNVAGGYSTPVGIYHLTYKTTNTYLEGYNGDGTQYRSHVNFWMPFNGGIGFHDAAWRSSFGGNIYMTNGSHGCVNMPYNSAKILYQNINTSIPIILYAS